MTPIPNNLSCLVIVCAYLQRTVIRWWSDKCYTRCCGRAITKNYHIIIFKCVFFLLLMEIKIIYHATTEESDECFFVITFTLDVDTITFFSLLNTPINSLDLPWSLDTNIYYYIILWIFVYYVYYCKLPITKITQIYRRVPIKRFLVATQTGEGS